MMRIGSALVVSACVLAGGCDKDKQDAAGKAGAPIAQQDGAEGLKALFAASHAACKNKEYGKGKQIVSGVIPTKDQLAKLFKPEVSADSIAKLADQYKDLPPSDEKAACVFAPDGRTEIRVHPATVEELAAYKEGTLAFIEFPGGARKLAETALLPGTTFYEVEVTEPGNDVGTKFHMFFWNGSAWKMMGPAWRVLKAE